MSKQGGRFSLLSLLPSFLIKRRGTMAFSPAVLPQALVARPAADDRDAWRAYWAAQSQAWRKEPEIDPMRQAELARCQASISDSERSIYPFTEMRLNRSDVEWLLATHDNGRGPVEWRDERQRERQGPDLRGANLSQVDLRDLPLARLRGGLTSSEWETATQEQRSRAAMHLEGADLGWAQLQGANLREAHLDGAHLRAAHLEVANLSRAQLQGANLHEARLQGANLRGAHLEGADLYRAQLQEAYLREAQLQGANLSRAHLDGANLAQAKLDDERRRGPRLADIEWGTVNLTVVEWSHLDVLGDEEKARQPRDDAGQAKAKDGRLQEYKTEVRANRQLAVVLEAQGLHEDAARFAYRAQVLQKTVFRLQMLQARVPLRLRIRSLGAWLFSWFLFLLAGYGYKPGRSFLGYLLVIGTFMALYLLLNPHLAWYEAIVVSLTAFHGRGFSPSTFSPGDPLSIASAAEAFVGLIIEVTFIATLTRRFFGQ
jgi:uncharacterized protein YjbI with pentapeptide repeats